LRSSDDRKKALWEGLYLTRPEVEEFLQYVREQATLPWVFPMIAFAAYTGARRSEILRALVTGVNLAGGVVTIREKKPVRGKRSTRTARPSTALRDKASRLRLGSGLFCAAAVRRTGARREVAVQTAVFTQDRRPQLQNRLRPCRTMLVFLPTLDAGVELAHQRLGQATRDR
jgi:integrase